MDCGSIKKWVDERITVFGLDIPEDIQKHLEQCSGCREYVQSTMTWSKAMVPGAVMELTSEEASQFESALSKKMAEIQIRSKEVSRKKSLVALAPIALAAAAVVVFLVLSTGKKLSDNNPANTNVLDIQFDYLGADDIVPLFSNGDSDLLPSLIDPSTASYLTSQIKPGQMDEVLDSLSSDELKWLNDNFSMEI